MPQTTTQKRRRMRHSRLTMTTGTAILAVVSLSAMSPPTWASAFVTVAPFTSSNTQPSSVTTLRYMPLEQVSDFYQNFPVQSAVLTCGVKASVADTIAQVKPQIEEKTNKNKQNHDRSPASKASHVLLKASKLSPLEPHEIHQIDSSVKDNNFFSSIKNINEIDWEAKRNLAYVLYGGIFVGLMSHVEYSCVFPFIFGNEKSAAITTAKVFFDNLLVAPTVWLPPAYFIKAWVYSSEPVDDSSTAPKGILEEGLEKYLADVRDNQLLWKYWAIWFPAQSVSFSVVPDHLRVAFMASISFFWFILFSTVSSQGVEDTVASATKRD